MKMKTGQTDQNLRDSANAVRRGKFILRNALFGVNMTQINILIFRLRYKKKNEFNTSNAKE